MIFAMIIGIYIVLHIIMSFGMHGVVWHMSMVVCMRACMHVPGRACARVACSHCLCRAVTIPVQDSLAALDRSICDIDVAQANLALRAGATRRGKLIRAVGRAFGTGIRCFERA